MKLNLSLNVLLLVWCGREWVKKLVLNTLGISAKRSSEK